MDRATRLGPIIFLLAGAGAGLCVGMLTHNDPPFRVRLEESMPLVFLGGFVGALVGSGVAGVCARQPRLVRPLALASVALLGTAIAAPLGWIVGTGVASDRLPRADVKEDVQHLPPLGLAAGAGVGCIMGLCWAVFRCCWIAAGRAPNKALQQTGHATDGSARHNVKPA